MSRRFKSSFVVNFLIFADLIFATTLLAQDTAATVTGSVQNAGFGIDPLVDAELKLQGPPHTLFTVRADDYGNFKFTVLPPGTYTLKLTRFGLGTLIVHAIRVGRGE